MRKVWVVVANASRAKIYQALDTNTLQESKNLEHPQSRLPAHDLLDDKPGRAGQHMHVGPRHMDDKSPAKLQEKNHFALEIAHLLDAEQKLGNFERLHLIASDPFMSCLKEHMPANVTNCVQSQTHKDLTLSSPKEIREYLPPVL